MGAKKPKGSLKLTIKVTYGWKSNCLTIDLVLILKLITFFYSPNIHIIAFLIFLSNNWKISIPVTYKKVDMYIYLQYTISYNTHNNKMISKLSLCLGCVSRTPTLNVGIGVWTYSGVQKLPTLNHLVTQDPPENMMSDIPMILLL